jgi:hypothetical protein
LITTKYLKRKREEGKKKGSKQAKHKILKVRIYDFSKGKSD